MSALSDFVNALKHQSSLLDEASSRDHSRSYEKPAPRIGERLKWTRQDRNRIDYESECAVVNNPITLLAIKPGNRSRPGQKRGGGLFGEVGFEGTHEVGEWRAALQAASFTHGEHAFYKSAAGFALCAK